MPLNYYDWFCCRADELYALAKEYEIPIIAQAPMKGGLLKNINVENPTRFAIDFVKGLDQVEYILSGSAHMKSYQDTYNNLLSADADEIDFDLYKTKLQEYLNTTQVNCIRCNRCFTSCHKRVPIKALFNLYNETIKLDSADRVAYFNSLNWLQSTEGCAAHNCDNCQKCIKACPLHNDIPTIIYKHI